MKNCAYEDVHCTNVECNELMPRRTLQYHLVSKCRWRVVSCQFCSEMYTYKDSKVGMTCRFFCWNDHTHAPFFACHELETCINNSRVCADSIAWALLMEMCLPLGIISLSGYTKTTHWFSSSCIFALAPVLSQICPILRGNVIHFGIREVQSLGEVASLARRLLDSGSFIIVSWMVERGFIARNC